MPSLLGIAAAAIAIGAANSPSMPPSAVQTAPQVVARADTTPSGAVATPRQQDRTKTAAASGAH